MEHSLLVELSPQEALTLIRIANVDVGADDIGEANVTRLQSLGLVEQRIIWPDIDGYTKGRPAQAKLTSMFYGNDPHQCFR